MQPFFSVITPVYHETQYATRCIDSIVNQTFRDIEIILIDDGSSDESASTCDDYAKEDSRIINVHVKNGGVSRARNRGLEIAAGKYISFCDGDDYYELSLLSEMYKMIFDSMPDMASYQLRRLSTNNKKDTSVRPYLEEVELHGYDTFQYICDVAQWKTGGWQVCRSIWRKEIIDEYAIRFCETCGDYAEDLGFTIEFLLHAKRLSYLDEMLYCYDDTRTNSMMNTSGDTSKLNEINELSYYLFVNAFNQYEKDYYRLHNILIYNHIEGLFLCNTPKEVIMWASNNLGDVNRIGFFDEMNYIFYQDNRIKGVKSLVSHKENKWRFLVNRSKVQLTLSFMLNKIMSKLYFPWK